MKKKALALLMCAAMATGLFAGCGSDTADTGTDAGADTADSAETPAADAGEDSGAAAVSLDGSWPEETVLIGMEVYDTADEQFLALQNYLEYLKSYYNVSFMYSESLASAEDELNFIDSCASAGCQAIIGYYNVAGAQAIQEAIDLGMYYWGTEQYYDDFADNELYLGCYTFIEDGETENGDYLGGYQLGYSLGMQGVQHVFYCNGGSGFGVQMFIDREAGFEAGIAAAQAEGAEIQYDKSSDVVEGWPGTDDFTAAVDRKLSEDYDGVAVSFNAAALFQPIYDGGRADSIKVATIGEVSDTYYEAVQSGMIATVVYDCEEVVFANCMAQILNAVTGHADATRTADGKAGKILVNRWTISDADTYNAIYNYHDSGEFFISASDLVEVLVELNPDATFDTVADYYGGFTLEGAMQVVE